MPWPGGSKNIHCGRCGCDSVYTEKHKGVQASPDPKCECGCHDTYRIIVQGSNFKGVTDGSTADAEGAAAKV